MKKCLVVDDVEVSLFSAKKAITSLGMEFSSAGTPEEAMRPCVREIMMLSSLTGILERDPE